MFESSLSVCSSDLQRQQKVRFDAIAHKAAPFFIVANESALFDCSRNTTRCTRPADSAYAVSAKLTTVDYLLHRSMHNLLSSAPGTDTACVTFNRNGTLYYTNVRQVFDLRLAFNPESSATDNWLTVHINAPGEPYYMASEQVIWVSRGTYTEFQLKQTHVSKLGEPYSDCVRDGSPAATANNMFGGSYSASKCAETCRIRAMRNKCGAVPYIYQHFFTGEQASMSKENSDTSKTCVDGQEHSLLHGVNNKDAEGIKFSLP